MANKLDELRDLIVENKPKSPLEGVTQLGTEAITNYTMNRIGSQGYTPKSFQSEQGNFNPSSFQPASEQDLMQQWESPPPRYYSNPQTSNEMVRAQAYDTQQSDTKKALLEKGYDEFQLEAGRQIKRAGQPLEIGQTIGGIAGGILGPLALSKMIPGPVDDIALAANALRKASWLRNWVGTPLAASATAGLGGGIGKGIDIGIRERRVPVWKELLPAAATEALYEAGGRYGAMGAKLVFSPAIKKPLPEAMEFMERFGKNAVQFSPAELDKRITLRAAEAVSRGSFGADEIWREFTERQQMQIRALAEQFNDTLLQGAERLGPQQTTELFAKGITEPDGLVMKWMDDLFDPLYRQIDELTKKATVSTSPLKKLARQELDKNARMMADAGKTDGIYLTSTARNMLESVMGLKNEISHSDMRALRSRFLSSSRKMARDLDESQALVKRIAGTANDALFNPKNVRGMSKDAQNLWENTNRLYKAAQTSLKENFPERLAKSILNNPKTAIARIFPNKNPKSIAAMRQTLTEPISGRPSAEGVALWNQLRHTWYADVIDKATKEGSFSHTSYFNSLHRMGDEALGEMFSPDELKNIKAIQSGLKLLRRTSAQGTPLFTKAIQIGGAYRIYEGTRRGRLLTLLSGGALAVGPVAFAELATNPKTSGLLVKGLSLKSGSTEIIPIAARLIRELKRIDEDERSAALIEERKKRMRQQAVRRPVIDFPRLGRHF